MSNPGINWYKNRYSVHHLSDQEAERKFKAYLFEEEQLRLAEAFAMKQAQAQAVSAAGGGPKGPESTPEAELVTETGQAIVTETGAYLLVTG